MRWRGSITHQDHMALDELTIRLRKQHNYILTFIYNFTTKNTLSKLPNFSCLISYCRTIYITPPSSLVNFKLKVQEQR